MKRCIIFSLLIVLWSGLTISAQTLDEARELYKIGEYSKALPIFELELNMKPTDPALNQWYGVCLYETGGDLKKAEECLLIASKKGIQDAPLYLGRMYTKLYRFDEASKEYEKYAKLKRRDKEALARLEEEQEYLEMLKKAALRTEDIQIIDSVVVDKNDFLSAYKLSPSSGQLDYLKISPSDKSVESTAYTNEKETKTFYANSLGGDKSKYSLFSSEKLLSGFGNEKRLSDDNFGLSGSLNYPYVLSDGVTIYFAAQDEDNFGGYDLYVTRYNMNNDTYLTPERLNMPFNSLYNDYMMAIDEEKGVGWFASDRFQPEGKVCVYTFIPNEQVSLVENESEKYLIDRAAITSIKKSWKNDADYRKVIALARSNVEAKKQIARDFEFVIDDKYTYYKLDDFKDRKALDMFRQLSERKKEIKNIEDRLDNLRSSYHSGQSNSKANEILELEYKQSQLFGEIKDLEIKTRNQEIQSVRR